ncbi:phosphate propanoyltransferase [Zhaonella formicivorans]|uniref:phosphate propanoyltransferase n=1 Tax=Zhaonella formicivorans TaxID=2528593 RepID=UPI0010CE6852|nr:phosphate propanoyltransferase [Zhaonella formicivorans]
MSDKNLMQVPVGISNRHVHLSQDDLEKLFGKDYRLNPIKDLTQPGQYAAKELVTLVGTKGIIEGVRVLGPVRSQTQVEVSRTDCFKLGINAPVRESGVLSGSPGCVLVGPVGMVALEQGVIIAARHIHMPVELAKTWKLNDKDLVDVLVKGDRELCFRNVIVRVSSNFELEFHVDTDEANAALLKNGDMVTVLGKSASCSD